MKRKPKILLVTSLSLIVLLTLSIYVSVNKKKTSAFSEAINLLNEPDQKEDDELKVKFEEVLQDLFKNRNIAILNNDLEELKKFYDLEKKPSLWAYESESKKAVVQLAIGTLSYSELEAVEHIFSELNGDEGLLVASKIADKVGITRSVIVNALRKFESAGVIESRSLGMKGTHIKILNEKLMDELKKIKDRKSVV